MTVVAVLTVALAGCGSSKSGDYGGKAPDYSKALAGAPKPLASLYSQGGELVPGGVDAFDSRIAQLKGHPIVVNKWASWCGPCRVEMPWFQELSAKLGKRVAFVGVDSQDSDTAAKEFLDEFPLPYPSYSDPDKDIAQSMDATIGFPATVFYDSSGDRVHVQQGQYASIDALKADIAKYAQ